MNSTKVMCHNKRRKEFACDKSDLGFLPGVQLPDRIDVTSHVTGKVVTFDYLKTDIDEHENEVRFWVYKISAKSTRDFPHMSGYTLTLFND